MVVSPGLTAESYAIGQVDSAIKEIESMFCNVSDFTRHDIGTKLDCLLTRAITGYSSLQLQTCPELASKVDHVRALVEEAKILPRRLAEAQRIVNDLLLDCQTWHQSGILSEQERKKPVAWQKVLASLDIEDLKADVLHLSCGEKVLWTTSLLTFTQFFELLPKYHRLLDTLDGILSDLESADLALPSTEFDQLSLDYDQARIRELALESPPQKLRLSSATQLPPVYKGLTSTPPSSPLAGKRTRIEHFKSDDFIVSPEIKQAYSRDSSRNPDSDVDSVIEHDASLPEISSMSAGDNACIRTEDQSVCEDRQARLRLSQDSVRKAHDALTWTTGNPMDDTSIDLSDVSASELGASLPVSLDISHDFLRLPPQTPRKSPRSLSLDQRVDKIVTRFQMKVVRSISAPSSVLDRPLQKTPPTGDTRKSLVPTSPPRKGNREIQSASTTPTSTRSYTETSDQSPATAGWYTITLSATAKKDLYCRIVGSCVMVRVGGGWEELAAFLMNWAVHHTPGGTFSAGAGRREWAEMMFAEANDKLLRSSTTTASPPRSHDEAPDRQGRKGTREGSERRNKQRSRSRGPDTATAKLRKREDGQLAFEA